MGENTGKIIKREILIILGILVLSALITGALIVTDVEVLGLRWPIELTLADRDAMGFRMLLGRQAIRGRFLVDPGKSYYGGRPLAKQAKSMKHPRGAGKPDNSASRPKAARAARRPGSAGEEE